MEGDEDRAKGQVPVKPLPAALLLGSLLVVGVATPAMADQPVFTEDPGGVGVQVSSDGAPEAASDEQTSDPKVTHVSCQYSVGRGAGGLILRGVCSDGTAGAAVFDQFGDGQVDNQPFPTPPPGQPEPPSGPAVTPETLAQRAYRFLPLPAPVIHTNPPPTQDQLVNLATFLWVGREAWGARTATASVPGLAVTVTAVPVTVTWRMGEGGVVVCRGPGTPFDPAAGGLDQPGTCSYTYRRASAGAPAGRFTVTATTTWRITWTAAGAAGGGTLPPLSRSSQTALRVAEVQAINTS
jgi:hypothetical protein